MGKIYQNPVRFQYNAEDTPKKGCMVITRVSLKSTGMAPVAMMRTMA